MKRKVILAVSLVAILGGGGYLYQRNLASANGVLRTSGTVEGREINITAKVAGRIATLNQREGETVAAGATVLTLDNDDLTAKIRSAAAGVEKTEAEARVAAAAITNLKASLDTAAAGITAAQAGQSQARLQVVDANRHLDRLRKLYDQGGLAKETLDVAETSRDSAVAAEQAAAAKVEAARAAYHGAEAQIKMAESQLLLARATITQAQADLAYQQTKLAETTVTSPLRGVVVYRALEVGETVAPGMSILTLVDFDHLTVRVDIDESRLGSLKPGDPAQIKLDNRPDLSFPGRIATISRYGDFATQRDVAAGRQDLRTFRVTIALEPGTTGLNPGMTVTAEIPNPQGAR
ncbi:MAG: HlyD family efflux transporter periplasmic adaptor subunit [Desulfobulbaceae bacterium]|nr:HlyD family efflux transporter periplasmic adaptor subunit [Desulfobulbaceae bacterium]